MSCVEYVCGSRMTSISYICFRILFGIVEEAPVEHIDRGLCENQVHDDGAVFRCCCYWQLWLIWIECRLQYVEA